MKNLAPCCRLYGWVSDEKSDVDQDQHQYYQEVALLHSLTYKWAGSGFQQDWQLCVQRVEDI